MMHLQRNDMEDLLKQGLGTPETWKNLSEELQGVKTLEHPRVQKKVLVKAIRMQTIAMRCLAGEFDRLRDRIEAAEKDAKNAQKQLEKVNTKVYSLEAALEAEKNRVVQLEATIAKQNKRIDGHDGQIKVTIIRSLNPCMFKF
jgi:chromosome segregation ATPase